MRRRIFLLVPLGDRLPRRRLLVGLLTVAAVSLFMAATVSSLPMLVAASALIGVTTVAAPIIGPMAAGLVAGDRLGVVSGTLLSGSVGGILLGRAAGGGLGERAMLVEPLKLLRHEPALRRSCLYQACVFAGFSAVWTSPQLLTGPAYGLTAAAVGALGLVSAATMICAPLAGRLADRSGPDPVNLVSLLGTIAAAVVLAVGAAGGLTGLIAITIGVLLLDVTMQSGMTANLTRIYAIRPDSRLNTTYMTCAFLGSSTGSWLGARLRAEFGWPAVCALVAFTAAIALTRHLTTRAIVVTYGTARG